MNVNLSHRSLLDAYNAVLSGDPNTDWTIFTYDKGSNDLKVQDTGYGGLDALQDEFSDGRIQYALARVTDPNSGLPKYVQINWCGDGVPTSKKGLFHSHSTAVAGFFKAAHIQVNARNETDVEPARIVKRLADAGGAKYSVNNESPSAPDKIAPVGSAYKPSTDYKSSYGVGAKKETPVPARSAVQAAQSTSASPVVPVQPPAPKPVLPVAQAPKPTPAPIASASTPAPAPTSSSKPAEEDRIGKVGTAYTPVSLPKPGKLGNRWGAGATPVGANDDDSSSKPSAGGFAAARAAFGGGGGSNAGSGASVGGNAGGEKKLTWSERQALAKARDKEEEEKSMAASAGSQVSKAASAATETATKVTAAAAGSVSAIASSISSTVASTFSASTVDEKADEDQENTSAHPAPLPPSARPIPKPPAARPPTPDDDDDEGFEEPDAPPKDSPPRSRPALPPVNQPPAFPDEDDFEEEEGQEAKPPPMPIRTAVNPPAQPVSAAPEPEEEEAAPAPPPLPTSRPTPGIVANQPPSFPSDDGFSDPDEPESAPAPAPSARSMPPPPARVVAPVMPPRAPSPEPEPEPVAASMPAAGGGSGGGVRAKVVYDYEAAEDNELGLVEGEIVTNVEKIDDGWWSASNGKGESGLFPSNYVEELPSEDAAPPAAAARMVPPPPAARPAEPRVAAGKVAVALYDYEAAEENELSFKEGDRIVSIEEASQDWWSGQGPDGAEGLFPANYVELQQ